MTDNEAMIYWLIEKARGERSLRQFSKIIGVNVSTLSRVRNGTLIPRANVVEEIGRNSASDYVTASIIHIVLDHIEEDRENKKRQYDEFSLKMR